MRPWKILSVDDDVELQKLVATYLRSKGIEVLTSNDGWDAIRQIIVHKPDLVLTDLEMPKMGGLGLLEALRAARFTETTPFIVASAHGDQQTILKALKLGAEDFMVKPFSFEQLYQRIDQLLFRVDFEQLKTLLRSLLEPEAQATAAVWTGLDLSRYRHWTAIPAIVKGRHLCVLLPEGLLLSRAAQMTEFEALQKVVVLARFRSLWTGVWPPSETDKKV